MSAYEKAMSLKDVVKTSLEELAEKPIIQVNDVAAVGLVLVALCDDLIQDVGALVAKVEQMAEAIPY